MKKRYKIDNGGHYLSIDRHDYPVGFVVVCEEKTKTPWIKKVVGRYKTLKEAENKVLELNKRR